MIDIYDVSRFLGSNESCKESPFLFLVHLQTFQLSRFNRVKPFHCLSHSLMVAFSFIMVLQILRGFFSKLIVF